MLTANDSPRKTDRRVVRTKNAIASAFLELMKQKSISKITVKELCDLADINRKTFYTYYQSVYEVLSEIENDVISDFEDSIHTMKKRKPQHSVSDILLCVIDLLNENSDFVRRLFQVEQLYGLERKIEIILKKYIIENLKKFDSVDEKILNVSMDYIIGGAFSMYVEWFFANDAIEYKKLSDLLTEFINTNVASMIKFAQA